MSVNDNQGPTAVTAGFKAALVIGLMALALVIAGERGRPGDERSTSPPPSTATSVAASAPGATAQGAGSVTASSTGPSASEGGR